MGKLLQELKRRNVYKTATLYVVAGWVLLQVADTVIPIFGLPESLLRTLTLVMLAGFPFVLVLSWLYDYSAEGFVRTQAETGESPQATFGTDLIVIFLLLIIVAMTTYERFTEVDFFASMAGSPVTAAPSGVIRSSLNLGSAEPIATGWVVDFALSADGSRLAYALAGADGWELYARELDSGESRALNVRLPGHIAPAPTISADGESILYYAEGALMRVPFRGGTPQRLNTGRTQNLAYEMNAAWIGDDILFTAGDDSLHWVPATGGEIIPLTVQSIDGPLRNGFPTALPGGDTALISQANGAGNTTNFVRIALLELESGITTALIDDAYDAHYVPSGHILFLRGNTLWGVPFDISSLAIAGAEVELITDFISYKALFNYSVSAQGQLVYLPASDDTAAAASTQIELNAPVWVDRNGNITELDIPAGRYRHPLILPDDSQVHLTSNKINEFGSDIWSYEFDRDVFRRVTFSGNASIPEWIPVLDKIAYRQGSENWMTSASGGGDPQRLISQQGPTWPETVSPDGKMLVISGIEGVRTLKLLELGDEITSRALLEMEFNTFASTVSPNGRWIAYSSDESGRFEIFVRPFPNLADGKWQISANGGYEPEWRNDGLELYFRSLVDDAIALWAVPFETEPDFVQGRPQMLFRGDFLRTNLDSIYDANAAGDRFLIIKPIDENETVADPEMVSLVLVQNFFEELRRRVPPNSAGGQ